MKIICISFILSILLISCEATTKVLPDKIDVSAENPERIVPLSDNNSWTYLIETEQIYQRRDLRSVGEQKWLEIFDPDDIQLGSFTSYAIHIDSVDSGLGYCYSDHDIYYGVWDSTRNAFAITYAIEDFPAIGRYSYDYRMIDIMTLDLDAGRAYDCYIWENEVTKDKYYYYRGLGLVRVELMDTLFNVRFSMQLTEYLIK